MRRRTAAGALPALALAAGSGLPAARGAEQRRLLAAAEEERPAGPVAVERG